MKIDSLSSNGLTGVSKPSARATAPAKSADASAESVRLSAASTELSGGVTVNAAKVAEIKAAIAEGRFQINPSAIADRLVQSARELLQEQKRDAG